MTIENDDDDKELEKRAPEPDPSHVEVDTDDEDDDDGDDDPAPAAAASPEREDKRRNRWKKHTEARRRAEEERDRAMEDARAARAAADRALELARQQPTHAPPPQQNRPDPYEQRAEEIQNQMDLVQREFDMLPPAEQQAKRSEAQARYRKLQRELISVEAERVADTRLRSQPRESPIERYIQAAYPDIVTNPRAWRRAQYYWQEGVDDGRRDTKALLDETMARVRRELNTQGDARPAPTRRQQSLYSAPSQGARGGGSGGGKVTVEMTEARKALAKAAYPDLAKEDESLAYAKWAKNKAKRDKERQSARD